MSEVLQCSRDAIVAPIAILASHTDDQVRDLSADSRSSRIGAVFGTIKLLGDQLAIPTQDGLRFRDQGDLLQRLTSEPLPDRGQRRSLRIGQSESGWQMRAKNPVLCNQVFILQQELLVHHPGNVRQQPRYLRFLHRNAPSYSCHVFNGFGLFDHSTSGGFGSARFPSPKVSSLIGLSWHQKGYGLGKVVSSW